MAKILIVDDDSLMTKMYQGKFNDDGFNVAIAYNGQEGLEKVLAFKPDLILLDIMMPVLNGLEMLKKLKENNTTKNIPVILLTNVGGSEEDVDKGLNMGAVAYMVKAHFDPKDVVKKVKEILGGYVHELPKVTVTIEDEKETKSEVSDEARQAREELKKAQKMIEEASKKLKEMK